jgi:hypothetical protein
LKSTQFKLCKYLPVHFKTMTDTGAIHTSHPNTTPKMDGSSKTEQNRFRLQNIIRRAKTENNVTYNAAKITRKTENRRKCSAGLHIIEEEKTVAVPKTKSEFVTESMKHMGPHDMIAMLERLAQADNNFGFEALQGLKNPPVDSSEQCKRSRKERRNSSHVRSTPRLTKELRNLRASV